MKNLKETWKPVTIGGTTGIMMGAAAMYAAQTIAANDGEDMMSAGADSSLSPDAETVIVPMSDEMSFSEAFAAGRAASGSGGLFSWRGNVYGTYYADEWNGMSDADKELFASRAGAAVQHEATPDNEEVEAPLVADENIIEKDELIGDDDVQIVASHEEAVEDDVEKDTATAVSWDELTSDENDVRVVGYGDLEMDDGHTIAVQELDINGQRVAIIDVNKDGVADVAMSDLNHNQKMDDGEVIDLQTGEAITFTNDEDTFADNAANDDMSYTDFGAL